ncbi:MAG: hypothetical protein RLZZ324_551 [Candidatus Parcubacteria bacterium]
MRSLFATILLCLSGCASIGARPHSAEDRPNVYDCNAIAHARFYLTRPIAEQDPETRQEMLDHIVWFGGKCAPSSTQVSVRYVTPPTEVVVVRE